MAPLEEIPTTVPGEEGVTDVTTLTNAELIELLEFQARLFYDRGKHLNAAVMAETVRRLR